tara:strand:- start:1289 stop:1513 length:225 start_codon:yes stop_codon:yes gene_type:complete
MATEIRRMFPIKSVIKQFWRLNLRIEAAKLIGQETEELGVPRKRNNMKKSGTKTKCKVKKTKIAGAKPATVKKY